MSNKSTNNIHVISGIDVSKNRLDVYLHPLAKNKSFANNKKGISELVKYLKYHNVKKAVCESTGGYERQSIYYINSKGIESHIVNSGSIRSYAKALGNLAKTDNIDAKVIALFASNCDVKLYPLPNISLLNLKEKLLRRNQLVETIKIQKTQLKQMTCNSIINKSNILIDVMNEQVLDLEKDILEIINNDKSLSQKYNQILSVKGIGKICAFTLLIDLPELGTLSHKSITKLAGLAPMNRDSGLKQGKRFIQGGRSNIRQKLYMSVLSACGRVEEAMRSIC